MFTGKRTDRLEMPRQLRVDSEMGRVIRMRAMGNRRSIQQEILYLIDRGIELEEGKESQAASVSPFARENEQGQPMSDGVRERRMLRADGEPRKVKSA